MMQVQSQLKANQLEILNDQQRERDLESQISAYQARLNLTPETEQELTNISRGYEESKANYNSLQQKQMQSQLATSLEHQQQGEQFRIIDPPSLPNKPSSPNHVYFSLGGLMVGLCLGLSLTAVLEMIDVRVRQEKDLQGIVPVPHPGRNSSLGYSGRGKSSRDAEVDRTWGSFPAGDDPRGWQSLCVLQRLTTRHRP